MNIFKAWFDITHLKSELQTLLTIMKNYESDIQRINRENTTLESKIEQQRAILNSLQSNIELTKGQIICDELKAYSYPAKKTNSEKLEKELKSVHNKITLMVSRNEIISNTSSYSVDGSSFKGAEFQKFYGESLLISFNNYFDKKAKSVTVNNYAKTRELIEGN